MANRWENIQLKAVWKEVQTVPEEKYYTVTLYFYSGCINRPYNLAAPEKHKVKAGVTLKNSGINYDPILIGAVMHYDNYIKRAKKHEELLNLYDDCYTSCKNNLDENASCYSICIEKYNHEQYYGITNEYDVNSPINSDISIVSECGCGSAADPEE